MIDIIETHPIPPFLPCGAKMLILGSFPPPESRWRFDFYYPNFNNDMWRIFGLVFFNDKDHFLLDATHFDKIRLEKFLADTGIALSDTGYKVRRLRGNASDQYLEIVEAINLESTIRQIPGCRAIITTGEKATSTLLGMTGSGQPPVGRFTEFEYSGRSLRHYRMPSSSRAYPRPLAEKASIYADMFREMGML